MNGRAARRLRRIATFEPKKSRTILVDRYGVKHNPDGSERRNYQALKKAYYNGRI